MEKNRENQLSEILMKVVQESGFRGVKSNVVDKETGEVCACKINGILKENPEAVKELEELGYVIISPTRLSDIAMQQMQNMQGDMNYDHQAEIRLQGSMVVDPKQEKTKTLAEEIIKEYYSNKDVYKSFSEYYKRSHDGAGLAELDAFGGNTKELQDILSKVGFSTEVDKEGMLVVKGNDFSINVDGISGKSMDKLPEKSLVQASKFEQIYNKAKHRIKDTFEKLKSFFKGKDQSKNIEEEPTQTNNEDDQR